MNPKSPTIFSGLLPRLDRTRSLFASPNSGAMKIFVIVSAVFIACQLIAALPLYAKLGDFVTFESGQVRPLALSPGKDRLYVTNTPDNRLEIYRVTDTGLSHAGSVSVGLEPVAVAVRGESEVWVVNHLSDSVSVVDVSNPERARVTRTLLVGDEPRDIVFAGAQGNRAFITCAHRGQNNPNDPQFTEPGVGRADVWVFDAENLGGFGGEELSIITLFGDTPRALAVTPDGSRVYAAVFHSGNRTTVLAEGAVPDGGEARGGLPGPVTNFQGIPGPEVSMIVRHDGQDWVDPPGRTWNFTVRFNLPDKDVFVLDANADPPAQLTEGVVDFSHVGTALFNMAVNPVSGKVYVSNTEARNHVRFEGPGEYGGSTVRGHIAESRITVLDPAGTVTPRHLNKHIDYDNCCEPIPNEVNSKSLAFPTDMVVSADGTTLYVTALGSGKVGIYNTAELEADSFTPDTANQVTLSNGGPTGLVLDEGRNRLYVLTRFDNGISIVDTAAKSEIGHVSMFNPEPEEVVRGRRFLYDAAYTSASGDQACASCHIFGDLDSLSWNLGNPDDTLLQNFNPFTFGPVIDPTFHPMKGPMSTQSLRGMDNHGPMHWRGDRTFGLEQGSVQPDFGAFNEVEAFKKFNPAFEGLVGRSEVLTDEEMQQFTDFVLALTYPPNPIRNLDNSLTEQQQIGRDFYFGPISDSVKNCNGCHVLDREGNAEFGVARPGFFGTDGGSSFEDETQTLKIPHLRNMYQKVGMFGNIDIDFYRPGDNDHMGDQIRGFGFIHDGSTDTLFRFHNAEAFEQDFGNPGGIPNGEEGVALRRAIEDFMMVFDSNLFPIVGQQITLRSDSGDAVMARLDLLKARADAGECDLVVKGIVDGLPWGARYTGDNQFQTDSADETPLDFAAVKALVQSEGQDLTFTAGPPGSGTRIGIDRDRDGYPDRDELAAGSDPADPDSIPGAVQTTLIYPWISNRQGDFESIMVINNTGAAEATVTLTARRNGGESDQATRTIPAGGFLEEPASTLFPNLPSGSGYAVTLTSPATAISGRWVTYSLQSASGRSPSQGVAVPVTESGESDLLGRNLLFGYLPLSGDFISAPVIVNAGTEAADIDLKFYNSAGTLVAESTLEALAPGEPFAAVANTLVPAGTGDVIMTASSATQPITGASFVFNNVYFETAVGNAAAFNPETEDGSSHLLYPWISHNEGAYASTLVTVNPTSEAVTVNLTARRETGDPVTAQRTIPAGGFLAEAAASLFPELGSGAGFSVELSAEAPNLHGWWMTYNLQADSGASPSQGVAVDIGPKTGKSSHMGNSLLFGYLPVTDDFISAPVILNAGASPTDVTLSFYDTNGTLLKQDTTTLTALAAYRPFARLANTLAGAEGGNVVLIATSNGEPITGVGFVFNDRYFEPAIGNATVLSP